MAGSRPRCRMRGSRFNNRRRPRFIHSVSSPDLIGRSSIPEAALLTSGASRILDAPPSRGMTAEETYKNVPAARNARALHQSCSLEDSEGAGNAGRRPHPWPACNKKSRRQSPQVGRTIRHSLRNGLRLMARSPRGAGLDSPRRSRETSRKNLTSASGGQDHTLSPSALAQLRLTQAAASIASRLTFRDDWP
jgi:hypothetical protein